jgi:hypothetical protein
MKVVPKQSNSSALGEDGSVSDGDSVSVGRSDRSSLEGSTEGVAAAAERAARGRFNTSDAKRRHAKIDTFGRFKNPMLEGEYQTMYWKNKSTRKTTSTGLLIAGVFWLVALDIDGQWLAYERDHAGRLGLYWLCRLGAGILCLATSFVCRRERGRRFAGSVAEKLLLAIAVIVPLIAAYKHAMQFGYNMMTLEAATEGKVIQATVNVLHGQNLYGGVTVALAGAVVIPRICHMDVKRSLAVTAWFGISFIGQAMSLAALSTDLGHGNSIIPMTTAIALGMFFLGTCVLWGSIATSDGVHRRQFAMNWALSKHIGRVQVSVDRSASQEQHSDQVAALSASLDYAALRKLLIQSLSDDEDVAACAKKSVAAFLDQAQAIVPQTAGEMKSAQVRVAFHAICDSIPVAVSPCRRVAVAPENPGHSPQTNRFCWLAPRSA